MGAAVGAVIVGLVSEGSGDRPVAGSPPTTDVATTSAETSGAASSAAASGQVTVNQACLDAVTGAQAAYAAVNDIAEAAKDLNAGRLDEIVRSLQPLQAALTDNIQGCNITATLPADMPTTGSAITGESPEALSSSSSSPTG